MTNPVLRGEQLRLAYGERVIVDKLDVVIRRGAITAIIGPNGCGKSTLLRSLSRLLKPVSGRVLFDDHDLHSIPSKQLARQLGLLPQSPIAPEGISVADLVGRGRTPYQGLLGKWTTEDYEAVAEAMEMTGIAELAERNIDELSGGQRQRVWIAMALAQKTEVLLLDEPTTYLDITHQLEVLDLLCDLNQANNTTIVMVLHDLNLAARYADELIAMKSGAVRAQGTPGEVMTDSTIHDIFDLDCTVVTDPVSNTPMIVPRGRHKVRPVSTGPTQEGTL